MKAIIIQDTDARALLDQLELETMNPTRRDYPSIEMAVIKILAANLQPLETSGRIASLLTDPASEIVQNIHRRFHYVVTRWLQEQGASVVR